MMAHSISVLFFACVVIHAPLALSAEVPAGALAAYVAREDGSFRWNKRRDGSIDRGRYVELTLVSQIWRDIVWKHQLFIVNPLTSNHETTHALLVIAGGDWSDDLEEPTDKSTLPKAANLFATMAEAMQTPVAVLLQVPRQPMFDGKREDAIISMTFDKFLESRDTQWPLLLPMVKSAVRGMDAIQAYAEQAWGQKIESFTVTGASKRGWTTWLAGAIDRRVTAVAPMAIDMLNMDTHLRHQQTAWGGLSEKIHDYTERDLHMKLESDVGRTLLGIVDPYQYREWITQPKLIVIGTNDRYWPLDALNLYWDELKGAKHILYVPNNSHWLRDLARVVGSVLALHRHVGSGQPLPDLTWRFEQTSDRIRMRINSDIEPVKVQAWVATSRTRDFRSALWESYETERVDGGYAHESPVLDGLYTAVFGEAKYTGATMPFFLSTNVQIGGARDHPSPGR